MKPIPIKDLYNNYLFALHEKVIEHKISKEEFWDIHKDFPKEAYPLPSHLASKRIIAYHNLHNHYQYTKDKRKENCPICNLTKRKQTRKKRKT